MSDKSKSELDGFLIIDVPALHRQPIVIDTALSREWLAGVMANCEYPVTAGTGHCRLRAESAADGVRIRGDIRAEAFAECVTCLEPVTLHLHADVDVFMAPVATLKESGEELTPEDLEREYFEGDIIHLSNVVSDGILLELPINPRCEGPCHNLPGLVTSDEVARRNFSIDPRLKALADIKISKEN